MAHSNGTLAELLRNLDLGASVAETDNLLQAARVDTSAFADLLNDRVDLVPGTKGSGKSALFRIIIDFLPDHLLRERKVVIAHGVHAPGDAVFHAFTDQFATLDEEEFVSFWCVYLVSLAHEQFVKSARYQEHIRGATKEIATFRDACARARIPEIEAPRSLRNVLEWSLGVLKSWRPKVTFSPPGDSGEFGLDLFGNAPTRTTNGKTQGTSSDLPKYVNDIKENLEAILRQSNLSLWLMVDRLDEIFPRRSPVERNALRGLLRAMRFFTSPHVRVKVFLRDDMLEEVVQDPEGFTALTHITARQADTLRWTPEQLVYMLLRRIFANREISEYLQISQERLDASAEYRQECFYRVFPPTVHRGAKQASTLKWIYNRCADGRGVVTPRDVLDLVLRAKQRQQDICASDTEGVSESVIGASAMIYGYEELSRRKLQTYLQAEFPHLQEGIQKFKRGKTEYSLGALKLLLGSGWDATAHDLVSIGFLAESKKRGTTSYSIPFIYRHSLQLTQGKA